MPVGYVITLVIFGTGILSALLSVRRPRALRWLSYRLAVSINEIPFLIALLLLASTALALPDLDPGSAGSILLLGLVVLEIAGLVVVLRRGLAAGPVVRKALNDGLGSGWEKTIRPGDGQAMGWRPSIVRILLFPIVLFGPAIKRERNLSYGVAGRENLLDLYRPRRRDGDGAVLIFMHGGGYHGGGKSRESRALISRLTRRGWTCVSANYRLRPEAGFTEHLVDMKRVIAWVRDHGHEYGLDPAKVFVAGSSAGGHLAALAALNPNDPEFQPEFGDADTSIAGAICLSGYFGAYYGSRDDPEGPATSPFDYVDGGPPPFFVAHGGLDSQVPVERARGFAAALKRASTGPGDGPVIYAELPGGHHSFDLFHSFRYEAVVDGIEGFTAAVLSRAAKDDRNRLSRSDAR